MHYLIDKYAINKKFTRWVCLDVLVSAMPWFVGAYIVRKQWAGEYFGQRLYRNILRNSAQPFPFDFLIDERTIKESLLRFNWKIFLDSVYWFPFDYMISVNIWQVNIFHQDSVELFFSLSCNGSQVVTSSLNAWQMNIFTQDLVKVLFSI